MDVVVLSTGHKFHKVDSQIGALLLELFPANLQQADSAALQATGLQAHNVAAGPYVQNVAEPRWSVEQLPISGRWSIRLQYLAGDYHYEGHPDNAVRGIGRPVPEQILAQYRKVWRSPEQ